MDINVWSDVSVNVESVRGSAVPISAITKANPAVVTYTGSDVLADGDVVLVICSGMLEIDYLVARVDSLNAAGNTFELEGVDSSDYGTFTSGNAYKLTFGNSADTFTDVNWSGGDSDDINIRTIHRSQDISIPGNFTPQICNLGSLWDVSDPALAALKSYSRSKTAAGIEVIFANGQKVYFAATPSTKLAPGGSAGGPVTTPVKLSLRGDVTTYAS